LKLGGAAASHPRCGGPVCPGVPDRRHRRQTCGAGVTNAALANLIRQLADAYGPRGVTVHMIAPGALDTDRLRRFAAAHAEARGVSVETVLDEYRSHSPLGRMTTVDQVSWAVTQLLAPEADALHGATLALDGGARRGLF
jgi:NAD(P)-dependent dehydrogenase (short-subunit alcohol dehydrogenase family)